jgi:hypothetical protein
MMLCYASTLITIPIECRVDGVVKDFFPVHSLESVEALRDWCGTDMYQCSGSDKSVKRRKDGAQDEAGGVSKVCSYLKRLIVQTVSVREYTPTRFVLTCFLLRQPPPGLVRDYFGEEIAFYFTFLGAYSFSLMWPSAWCGCGWLELTYVDMITHSLCHSLFLHRVVGIFSVIFLAVDLDDINLSCIDDVRWVGDLAVGRVGPLYSTDAQLGMHIVGRGGENSVQHPDRHLGNNVFVNVE